MKKRIFSLLLALVMVMSLLPTVVFAEVVDGSVWQIGEGEGATGYTSLSEAIDAASEAEPTTIKAIANASIAEDYSTVTKNITIDTADKTVYFNEGAKLSSSMNVTSSGGNLYINYGALIGGNVTVTGGNLGLNINTVSGTITVSGEIGKLQAQYNDIVVAESGVTLTAAGNMRHSVHNITGGTVTLTGAMPLDVYGTLGSNVTVSEGAAGLCLDKNATVTGTVTMPETGINAMVTTSADITYKNADSLASIISDLNSGDTVKLLSDVTVSSNIQDSSSKTYTLDLNGHTVTFNDAYYQMYGSVKVTIKDGSDSQTGKIVHEKGNYPLYVMGSAKLTIESGTFNENVNSSNTSLIYTGGTGTAKVEIKGGIFNVKGSSKFIYENGGNPVDIYDCTVNAVEPSTGFPMIGAKGSSAITFYGGTFNTGNRQFVETNQTVSVQGGLYDQDVTAYCAMGKTCEADTDHEGYYKIVARTADNSTLYLERKDGTRIFGDSVKNAMAEAQDGDSVVLLQDVKFDDTIYTSAKNFTLDLNDYTLGKGDWVNGQIDLKEDMTIKNGTILCESTSNSSAINVSGNKDVHLTLENVKVKAAVDNAPIEIFANSSSNTVSLRITAKGQNEIETIDEDGNIDYGYAIVIGTDSEGNASIRSGTQNLTIDGDGTLKLYGGIYVESTAGMTGKNPHKNTITISNPNVEIPLHKYQMDYGELGIFDVQDPSLTAYFYGNYQAPTIDKLNYSPSVQLNISGGRYFSTFQEMAFDRNSSWIEMPDGVTMFDGSVLTGGQYFAKPAARYIADGYEAVPYSNPAYPGLHYEIVKIKQVVPGEAVVDESTNKITIGEENVTVTQKGTDTPVATQEVADIITDTLNNDNVSEFDGTNIEANTDAGAIKTELKKVAPDDTAKANIDATTNILKQITVDLTATSVETIVNTTSTTVINSMTFEVKPIARTTIEKSNGYETTVEVVIPNELITEPLTFRLFVDKNVTATQAAVYHGDGKDYIGVFPIQTAADGKKFIELSAKEFSLYTYETITGLTADNVAMIPDGNGSFTGYDTLDAAIEAGAGKTIILLKDITETDPINFASKTLELDLNGHVLTGTAVADSAKNVTVSNNDAARPDCLAVIGVFANNVKAFVADGYDARTSTPAIEGVTNNEVFSNNATDVFTVKVVTSTDTDRDTTNDETEKNVDVFAGDTVHAEVRIYGARSVAAKVALKYDGANLTLTATPDGWDSTTNPGTISFYEANTDGITYWELDKTDEKGTPYYLLGEFDFTVDDVEESYITEHKTGVDANNNPVLKDMFEIVGDTYVAGAWKDGWSSNPANKVQTSKIFNDFANIRLKQMSVVVTPSTDLVYKNANLYLFQNKDMEGVDKDFTATDKNTLTEVTGAEIVYAVTAKGDAAPAASAYSNQYPTKKDAGDYTVHYKVTKPGYVTVTGQQNVSIAKRDATLTWSAAGFNAGSITKTPENASFWTESDFNKAYDGTVFSAPTAKYVNADGTNTDVPTTNITMTSPAAGTLQAVGSYVYTATINDNYNVLNPTCTLLIDGGQIEGYELTNTDEGPNVFVDKRAHAAADLDVADDATPATVKYFLSSDDGKNYGVALDAMPTVTEVGKYAVKVVISADGYYDQEQIVKFEIKRVEFFTEKTEYVVGWKLILVYTNETVPGFTYDGHYMYDVTTLDYKYLEQKNDTGTEITVAGTAYTHVYAILVKGAGDETLVVPSNDPTMTHTIYPEKGVPGTLNRNDTNENGACDINDLIAVQAVYNVDTERYLNDAQMHIALKADVTGNKVVDMSDYQRIKTNS